MAKWLERDEVYLGEAQEQIRRIEPESIALSVWSPPYHVGKSYEAEQGLTEWREMLAETIWMHGTILRPGGFMAVNINDILCFPDETMPRIQAKNEHRRRCGVTEEDVMAAREQNPGMSRRQLAELLGCSEQTVDRRLHGNNIRGGKHSTQTRVMLVGGMLEEMALRAGLFPYDRRIWVKDPAWANSRWAGSSYRAVDEFEYVYIFWKPGVTAIRKERLPEAEWREWGMRGVWYIPSVRRNDDHEAKFPRELPARLIRLLTDEGDTILDCFMGSGTTGEAALAEGRHYIGIEKEEQYVDLARENIAKIRRMITT